MRQVLQKWNTRFGALLLAVLLLLPVLPAASAAEASGTCGSGVEWELSNGVLTVSGKGTMADYSEGNPAPWKRYGESIHSVRVEQGVTGVGDFAFFLLENVTSVTLAQSVQTVGNFAFFGCAALKLLDLGGVEEIGERAFERCTSLVSVRLPQTLTTLRFHAFYRCESLVSITVPAGVTVMESAVFAYCHSLRSATVLANIGELPLWTFYGCYALSSVSLTPLITSVGVDAFHDCQVEEPVYNVSDGKSEHQFTQETTQPDGTKVTTNEMYSEGENSSVSTQITHTKTEQGTETTVKIDAVLENSDGWEDVSNTLNTVQYGSDSVKIDVSLKGDAQISGEDLSRVAGTDVTVTIHTPQGAKWHVNGKDLTAKDLAKQYDLSYTLKELTELDEAQTAAVGDRRAFEVVFHNDIDFKVKVELPLGEDLARQTAVFFDPGEDGYTRAQAVIIDGEGTAYFHLARVAAETGYLIGINVPQPFTEGEEPPVSDVIIPDTLKSEYPGLEQTGEIQYVVTGVKSSWGINMGQMTWIIVGVLLGSFVVVGAVLFALNKKKLKSGYVPQWDDEDE